MNPGGPKPSPGLIRILDRIAECRAMADREAGRARLEVLFRAAGLDAREATRLARLAMET